jgi:hypothetical protein
MILQPRDGRLLLIRQTDHAALAGELAEHWGNREFSAPVPRQALLVAAAHHDDGWLLWEAAPRVDPATRRPYQFTDMPLAEHAAFYRAGISRVLAEAPYAGLLVNMHLAGLYQRRFGTDPDMPVKPRTPEEDQALREILEQLEDQRRTLHGHLPASGVPAPFLDENHLGTNYKLLQVFDRLSLYFCTTPPRESTLGPVPVDYEGHEARLALRPLDGQTVAVSPYPFDADPLRVGVRASVVPDRPYDGDDDFRAAFAAAPTTELSFVLRAGVG